MNISRIAAKKPHFVAKEVDGDLILVPLKNAVAEMDELYTINEVGLTIWDAIEPTATLEAIVEKVVAVYDVSKEDAEQDVEVFLTELTKVLNA